MSGADYVCNALPGGMVTIHQPSYKDAVFNGQRVGLFGECCAKIYDIDPNDEPKYGHSHPSRTHPFGWIAEYVYYSSRDGFMAALYTNGTDWVLAFRGSDLHEFFRGSWKNGDISVSVEKLDDLMDDWIRADIGQGLGFAANQYMWALKVAEMVVAEHVKHPTRRSLTFTGHSLGGGLAASAALSIGCVPAITFNAAGVHEASRLRALSARQYGGYDAKTILFGGTPMGKLVSYIVDGEFLNWLQTSLHTAKPLGLNVRLLEDVPVAMGETVTMPVSPRDISSGAGARHTMEIVTRSLDMPDPDGCR